MTAKRYIFIFTLSFLGLCALTIFVNYLVDPHLIFGSVRIEGLNQFKVDINERVRISKAFHSTYNEWNTLIVGNSRVEMGLDPTHACFQKTESKVYNLGIPGAGVRSQLEYALNVVYQQPIRRIYLSVDFVDFLVIADRESSLHLIDWGSPPGNQSLSYAFDGTHNSEYQWAAFMDKYRALFSLDALFSSIRTVALQSSYQPDRDDHGFNPARDFQAAVDIEGPHALFKQKMEILDKKYSHHWSLGNRDDSLSHDFRVLRKFLKIADSRGIRVTIFTNPFHVQFWDLIKQKNLYDMHKEWLSQLIKLVREVNTSDVQIWDFSGDSKYIHETVPKPGVKSGPLRWFWEPAHYRKELGDLMLETMLAKECQSQRQIGKRLF